MILATHGIISSSGGSLPLLLDTYSGAAAAYSLRKLNTAYTGNAITVRRSSDNTSQDIGFDINGNLDTTSLLSFVGSGNGFVSIWYDQSSTYNASQSASANQPQIVSSGSLITTNGKPTVKFDGLNDFLVTSSYSFTTTDKIYIAHVSSIETNNVTSQIIGHFKQFNSSIYFSGYRSTSRSTMIVRDATNLNSKTYDYGTYNINTQYLYEQQTDLLNATSNLRLKSYRNNTQETINTDGLANTSLPTFAQPISIGADEIGTNFKLKGNIQEIVAYYNVDQSSNRGGIASNINTYYNIY
jgi:hypothetical protein